MQIMNKMHHTSTVKIAGSSGANPFACVAAGVASLWGQPMEVQMNLL